MRWILLLWFVLNSALVLTVYGETADFIRGYVSAAVNDERAAVSVKAVEIQPDGEIILDVTPCLTKAENKRIQERLLKSKIISKINWKDSANCLTEIKVIDDKTIQNDPIGPEVLPEKELFHPLQADTHEARFSLSYFYYENNGQSANLGYITAGDTFPLLNWDYQEMGKFQLGLEGGVFALFNLDERSKDLVNADYILGIPFMYRKNSFSAKARIYHQSSHLGDEFIINNPDVERVNLSFEELELLGSYDFYDFRVIVGTARILHSEPNLEPWSVKGGLEFRSPDILGDFDFLASSIVSASEELSWNVSQSYKAGLALQKSGNRELQLMLQYYNGFSQNGQFFEEGIEYFGFGLFLDT